MDHNQQPAYPTYTWPTQPPQPPTSGLAVASMVIAIVSITIGWLLMIIGAFFLALVAVIFGHVAYTNDVKKLGKRGAGMAIAGLSIGYVVLGIGVVFLLLLLSGI